MIIFALSGTLIGMVLGVSFSVFALVPVMIGAVVLAAGSSILSSNILGPTAIQLGYLLICLQIGYLFASGLRFFRKTPSIAMKNALLPSEEIKSR